jgi:hypothetical protein
VGICAPSRVLADPADEEHEDLLAWLGLDKPADLDPARFKVEQANPALTAGTLSGS